ncbi:LysR family transcriptional regulator [Defluviimonas sp. WL0024]|uniref:LysR family transcriptional regulator n=1 Tax=Albidovulum salinarum TaxID=2984153 RepID=A0ABT2WYD0_9RHOB|nr:LysR family transcriptional regulator [Defluviimonas sp. WL0024]MCU9846686.1 LysR family transcriptional regulator [Defluviimonas sp. WL0024]
MPSAALDNLPLEWIRAFEAAGRSGSFTAAAQETGLTQAAISQRIGHLEERIGARLFTRKPRGVALTVEGEAWLPYVTNALTMLRQSSDDLFGVRHRKIVILASASVIQLWLAPRLAALDPGARLDISFSTMILQSDFDEQDATVEIRYGDGNWPDRYRVRLFAESLSPVAAPAIAAGGSWHDLAKIALSGPRSGWQEWARQTGDPATPVPTLRFDSHAAALAAAGCGLGVLLASLPLAAEALADGTIVRLSERTLAPRESYWMTASKSAISKRQWDSLAAAFAKPGTVTDPG